MIDDPKYGRVWTLNYAGWPNKSTVLGPLFFRQITKGLRRETMMPMASNQ